MRERESLDNIGQPGSELFKISLGSVLRQYQRLVHSKELYSRRQILIGGVAFVGLLFGCRSRPQNIIPDATVNGRSDAYYRDLSVYERMIISEQVAAHLKVTKEVASKYIDPELVRKYYLYLENDHEIENGIVAQASKGSEPVSEAAFVFSMVALGASEGLEFSSTTELRARTEVRMVTFNLSLLPKAGKTFPPEVQKLLTRPGNNYLPEANFEQAVETVLELPFIDWSPSYKLEGGGVKKFGKGKTPEGFTFSVEVDSVGHLTLIIDHRPQTPTPS